MVAAQAILASDSRPIEFDGELRAASRAVRKPSVSDGDARAMRQELVVLMWRVADGDPDAFAQLYRRTRSKLFLVAMRVCHDPAAAEDVLTDVYVTVWKNAGAYRAQLGSSITWLAVVTRNRALDWWRRQVAAEMLSSDIVETIRDPAPSSTDHMISVETNDAVRTCLEQLPLATRMAIQAAFFEGLTYAQLADRAGVPLGTMKSWIRRGLATMRNALASESELS